MYSTVSPTRAQYCDGNIIMPIAAVDEYLFWTMAGGCVAFLCDPSTVHTATADWCDYYNFIVLLRRYAYNVVIIIVNLLYGTIGSNDLPPVRNDALS